MNKFKVGDKVVCVNVEGAIKTKRGLYDGKLISELLNLYETYEIIKIDDTGIYKYIRVNNNIKLFFKIDRFITLNEYRKMKINKIFF